MPSICAKSFWSAMLLGGVLFAASTTVRAQYQIESWTTDEGLPQNTVHSIVQTPDGYLWLATLDGLVRFDGVRFTVFNKNNSRGIESNRFTQMVVDREGVLWIGSYDGGLTRLKNGKLTRYTTADGLFNDGVFQILEDDKQNLWMSSNRGIYRVSKQGLNDFADGRIARIESIAYGKADGLLETECNGGQQPAGIRARDGKLWFPTQRGVAVIDPNAITTNPYPPPVVIESIKIDNSVSEPPAVAGGYPQIQISPGKNNLEINYTGLSFVKPEQIRFRYKLDGLDSDWTEAGERRTAYYSYLPPGGYTFQVIAANSDGVWNEAGASLRVRVVPSFYRTWWFAVLGIACAFGLLIAFYQWRVSKLERARAVQTTFSRRLIESQEHERSRIAAELHDGLSQSLVIIKNRAVLSLTTPDDAERAFEQIEEISQAASEAMFEAKEIIYNLRPIQLDRFGLTRAIKAMLKKVGDAHDITLTTDIDSLDRTLSKEAESNLYRILQELINNVVRHSNATETLVSIKRTGDSITLVVRDNGRGFELNQTIDDEAHNGGFGLLGVVERARLLDGRHEIQSVVGSGTTIRISLPVKDSKVTSDK